jgi:hypothetical protein
MALNKLMYPPLAFYQNKIHPTLDVGLSRIEYSAYFNSWEDYNQRFSVQEDYIIFVDKTLESLNKMKDKFYYKIPL